MRLSELVNVRILKTLVALYFFGSDEYEALIVAALQNEYGLLFKNITPHVYHIKMNLDNQWFWNVFVPIVENVVPCTVGYTRPDLFHVYALEKSNPTPPPETPVQQPH